MDNPALAQPTAILRLRKLFPTGTSIAWSESPRADDELLPAEIAATVGMAAARRQAYAQGRWCAHRALAQLGLPDAAVLTGEQRSPLWPPGITGSIAHCAGRAIGVAARLEVAGSVGVDMEETGDLEAGVLELVCTPAERKWLAHSGDAPACADALCHQGKYLQVPVVTGAPLHRFPGSGNRRRCFPPPLPRPRHGPRP